MKTDVEGGTGSGKVEQLQAEDLLWKNIWLQFNFSPRTTLLLTLPSQLCSFL